jgi:hypothetical protein|tara:strand:- start:56 stop:382 length:327 start_codon:yes stop_codon:yes gene_type:complete
MATNLADAALNRFFGAEAEDLLGDDPLKAFFAREPELARSPNERAFFRSLYPTVRNEFLGSEARSVLSGVLPTQTFTDFSGKVPLLERFLRRSRITRGLKPRTEFNFF